MRIRKIVNNNIEKDKYEELYKLSLLSLKEDQDRFNRIDEKASRFLSIFAILNATYGFFGKWILENIVPPKYHIEYLMIIISTFILITLALSWFMVFKMFKAQGRHKTNFSGEMIKFFENHKLKDIYYKLSQQNSKSFEGNRTITDQKTNAVKSGYFLIKLTAILMLCLTITFILYYFINV